MQNLNILVLGSGGREHAICWAIKKSKLLKNLYAIPGNAGIGNIAQCLSIDILDFEKIYNFCIQSQIDIVVVGPELPLAKGISDYLEGKNINVIGCSHYASNLESSKSFTKKICDEMNIKTANYKVFYNQEEAIKYIQDSKIFPQVIKADGLAAGKGVIIAKDIEEAIESIKEIFSGKFGTMDKIVIEDFLEGVEASFFAISDGDTFQILSNAGDHKRIGDNDEGPNTGGMGTYSPSPYVTKEVEEEVIEKILRPTFNFFKNKNSPFKGFIFAGLMITKNQEVYLIEYNVRLGDPETQSILARLDTDLLEILLAVSNKKLKNIDIKFTEQKAITLVVAANGYPGKYRKDTEITNLENLIEDNNTYLFHAGTKLVNGRIYANGGRVLNITSVDPTYANAYHKVLEKADKLEWEDKYYRRDIGKKLI